MEKIDKDSVPELTKDSVPEKKNVFKENWNKVDKRCPCCNQVTEKQKGMTKENLKKLISFKWNANEVIITIMIIMMLLLAFAYNNETKKCRDWITPMFKGDAEDCKTVCDQRCMLIEPKVEEKLNLTNENFTLMNDIIKP